MLSLDQLVNQSGGGRESNAPFLPAQTGTPRLLPPEERIHFIDGDQIVAQTGSARSM